MIDIDEAYVKYIINNASNKQETQKATLYLLDFSKMRHGLMAIFIDICIYDVSNTTVWSSYVQQTVF